MTPRSLQRGLRREHAALATALLGISLLAWAGLAGVAGSPFARFLDHDAGGAEPWPLAAAAFAGGWSLMIVAMMLPSSIPLVVVFGTLVSRRDRPVWLLALLLLGYLVAWTAFGLLAWVADRAIHAAVAHVPWVTAQGRLILAGTLAGAGLWQLSPLRERCLEQCRAPLGFVLNRWRGTHPAREAVAMGLAHGAFCIGCCWGLMLVLFGVGMSSLPLMLGLGALTAVERNMPRGRLLSRPVGVLLLLAGVYALSA